MTTCITHVSQETLFCREKPRGRQRNTRVDLRDTLSGREKSRRRRRSPGGLRET